MRFPNASRRQRAAKSRRPWSRGCSDPVRSSGSTFCWPLLRLPAEALSAALTGARFVPPAPRPANAVSDYLTIVSTNEQVLLSMALGLPALGVYGNLVMLCNWFRFGSDCVAILHGSAHELIYIGIHGPLELIALTLAAAAVQELGCAGLGSLVWAQKFRWRAGVRRYALAGALLAVIAVIEVISKGMRAASAHLSLNIWPGF